MIHNNVTSFFKILQASFRTIYYSEVFDSMHQFFLINVIINVVNAFCIANNRTFHKLLT